MKEKLDRRNLAAHPSGVGIFETTAEAVATPDPMKSDFYIPPHHRWQTEMPMLDELVRHLLELGSLRNDSVIVDIASGRGTCAIGFAPHVAKVIALDRAKTQVRACRAMSKKLLLRNVRVIRHDVQARWPIQGQSVDIVTGVGAFSNLDDPGRALDEARRVLKPDGQLLIGDFFLPASVHEIWSALSSFRLGKPRPLLDYYEFLDLLNKHHFQPLEYRPFRWRASMDRSTTEVSEEMLSVFRAALTALGEKSIQALRLKRKGDTIITVRDVFAMRAGQFRDQPTWYIDDTRKPEPVKRRRQSYGQKPS